MLAILAAALVSAAGAMELPAQVQVAWHQSKPVSFRDADGSLTGIGIDLAKLSCERLRVSCSFVEHANSTNALQSLLSGSSHMVASFVNASADLELEADITIPYLHDQVGFAIPLADRLSPLQGAIKAVTSDDVITVLCLAFTMANGFAVLNYLAEKFHRKGRHNEAAKEPILNANITLTWWALATMTTVGYGDIVPKAGPTKLVALLWMVLSVLTVALMAGVMMSAYVRAMAVGQPSTIFDMQGSRLCVVSGSPTENLPARFSVESIKAVTARECFELAKSRAARGVLESASTMASFLSANSDLTDKFGLVMGVPAAINVGLVFPSGSRNAIRNSNVVVLESGSQVLKNYVTDPTPFLAANIESLSNVIIRWSTLGVMCALIIALFANRYFDGKELHKAKREHQDRVDRRDEWQRQEASELRALREELLDLGVGKKKNRRRRRRRRGSKDGRGRRGRRKHRSPEGDHRAGRRGGDGRSDADDAAGDVELVVAAAEEAGTTLAAHAAEAKREERGTQREGRAGSSPASGDSDGDGGGADEMGSEAESRSPSESETDGSSSQDGRHHSRSRHWGSSRPSGRSRSKARSRSRGRQTPGRTPRSKASNAYRLRREYAKAARKARYWSHGVTLVET